MQNKTITNVRVKDAELGIVEAVFASHLVDPSQLGQADAKVIDKDGDVTLKGAFTDGQAVVISAYGHGSWEGRLPVGKGVIREVGDQAVMEGQFFMNTPHGRDTFETVKELSADDLQEWSYSLHEVTAVRGTVAGKAVRILQQVKRVKEVSPVLMGAGVDTHTLSTKDGRKQLDSSLRCLLRAAGRGRWNGWVCLEDYDLDEGYAVYCVEDFSLSTETYYRVEFTRTDTSVTLSEGEVEVHESSVYLPKAARGLQFSEHVAAVMADVDALTARATDVVALRAEKGKAISADTAEQLHQLVSRIGQIKALIEPATTEATTDDEAIAEFARFVAHAQGV